MEGILVCKEARPGLEVIVGVTEDKVFGPTIMFGLGGIFAETIKDTSFRVVPLTSEDAEELVHEIRGSTVLEGARGRSVYDTKSLIDLILTVSRLVVDHPEIKELDLNPVRLFNRGLEVLDVRLFLEKGVD